MTYPAFKMGVGRIAKMPLEIQQIIFQASENMIATQKKVHPSEQDALDYMKKRFTSLLNNT
jgi:hypothetical protein